MNLLHLDLEGHSSLCQGHPGTVFSNMTSEEGCSSDGTYGLRNILFGLDFHRACWTIQPIKNSGQKKIQSTTASTPPHTVGLNCHYYSTKSNKLLIKKSGRKLHTPLELLLQLIIGRPGPWTHTLE